MSVESFDGRNLPYTDNLVNLIVAEDMSEVSEAELLRVLTPPAGRKGKARKPSKKTVVQQHWSYPADLEVRAMVLTDKTLFVAGVLGETHRSLDAFAGKEGIQLRAISAEAGEQLAEYPLGSPPVFDGLVATDGRLYLATKDGNVTCFGEK